MRARDASLPMGDAAAPHDVPVIGPESIIRRRRRRSLAWLAVLACAGLIVWAVWPRPAPPPVYRTVPVMRRSLEAVVEASGHVSLRDPAEVWVPERAVVQEVWVRPGDVVEKGQRLARLDDRAAKLQLRAAQAEQQVASARETEARVLRDAAQQALERVQAMLSRGLAARADVERAQTEFTQARVLWTARRSEHERARTAVTQAEEGLAQTSLEAPTDGVVVQGIEQAGVLLDPLSGPAYVVAPHDDPLGVEVLIGEAEVGALAPRQEATFTVPSYPERVFRARVDHVGRAPQGSDTGAVAYRVWLEVLPPREGLRVGLTASLSIRVARVEDALAVEEAALRFVPEHGAAAQPRSRVWQIPEGGGLPVGIDVETGISDGTFTQLIVEPGSPPREGEQVIVGYMRPDEEGAQGFSLRRGDP